MQEKTDTQMVAKAKDVTGTEEILFYGEWYDGRTKNKAN